ncbi:MAG: nuclear transport factor 2 family protein [Bacteroidota bacterium]
MKEILRILLRIAVLVLILILVTRVFRKADENIILYPAEAPYSLGNASDSTRQEILSQLRKFQDGYSKRDPANIDAFMQSLYSMDNILILGTMPKEIYAGFENATRLVKADWESWGDCKFDIDSAHISSSGNTAWFSTRGYVEFDMSRLLVLPLRLSGVMVKEDQIWRFRQQQFQFDVDFKFSLFATLVISVWIIISIITLSLKTIRTLRKKKN